MIYLYIAIGFLVSGIIGGLCWVVYLQNKALGNLLGIIEQRDKDMTAILESTIAMSNISTSVNTASAILNPFTVVPTEKQKKPGTVHDLSKHRKNKEEENDPEND